MSNNKKVRKSWSKEEDEQLMAAIKKTENVTKGCRIFIVSHPERTFSSAQMRWYKTLRYNTSKVSMMTVTKKGFLRTIIEKIFRK